jgi:hypothetical protein
MGVLAGMEEGILPGRRRMFLVADLNRDQRQDTEI